MPRPGPHGGDGARLARALGVAPECVLDLSMSVNPFAPDVAELVVRHAGALRRYPDVADAQAALADACGVAFERVVLTNGGAEAIALVAALQPRGEVQDPEFSLYARHLRSVDPGAPRWRSNPNNPTGALAPAGADAAVWDEAFFPLATGRWTRGDDAIVVGSLTKVFACPGLRAGYVLAPDVGFAEELRMRQPRWSVGSLACAIVPELLADAPIDEWSSSIAHVRNGLVELLRANGLEPNASDANFVLVRDAPGLRSRLARAAILVRDTGSFGIPGGVRIAVPHERDLERLRAALLGYRHG